MSFKLSTLYNSYSGSRVKIWYRINLPKNGTWYSKQDICYPIQSIKLNRPGRYYSRTKIHISKKTQLLAKKYVTPVNSFKDADSIYWRYRSVGRQLDRKDEPSPGSWYRKEDKFQQTFKLPSHQEALHKVAWSDYQIGPGKIKVDILIHIFNQNQLSKRNKNSSRGVLWANETDTGTRENCMTKQKTSEEGFDFPDISTNLSI